MSRLALVIQTDVYSEHPWITVLPGDERFQGRSPVPYPDRAHVTERLEEILPGDGGQDSDCGAAADRRRDRPRGRRDPAGCQPGAGGVSGVRMSGRVRPLNCHPEFAHRWLWVYPDGAAPPVAPCPRCLPHLSVSFHMRRSLRIEISNPTGVYQPPCGASHCVGRLVEDTSHYQWAVGQHLTPQFLWTPAADTIRQADPLVVR